MAEDNIKQKDPGSIRNFTLDYSDWLDSIGTGLTVVASTWTVPAGITQVTASFTTTSATIRLSGGTDGTDYVLSNNITLSDGQTEQFLLVVQVREVEFPATILVATAGATNANSYGTLTEAKTYFSRKPYTDAWDAANAEQQENALLEGAIRLDQLDFIGIASTDTQSMKWPRKLNTSGDLIRNYAVDAIPTPLKRAQFELAYWILATNGGSVVSGNAGDVESLKIGSSVEVKYTSGATTSTAFDPTAVEYSGLPITVARLLSGLRLIPVLA